MKNFNNIPINKYYDIKLQFEKSFSQYGYSLDSVFGSEVWFLTNCETVYSMERNTYEYENVILYKEVLNIIKNMTVPKRKSSISQGNTRLSCKFQVKVEDFIEELSNFIGNLYMTIENRKKNVRIDEKTYKTLKILKENLLIQEEVYEKKGKDDEKDDLLRVSNEKSSFQKEVSHVSISIQEINHISTGDFKFKLIIKELDKEFTMIKHEKKLSSNKNLKILNSFESIKLNQLNLNSYDISFPDIYLKPIKQNELEEHIRHGGYVFLRHLSTNFHKKSSIEEYLQEGNETKGNSSKINKKSLFSSQNLENNHHKSSFKRKQKNKTYTPKLSLHSQITKNNLDNSLFSETKPHPLTEVIYLPTAFHINKSSGFNLYSVGIYIEKNEEYFGETEDFILDWFISNINLLAKCESTIKINGHKTYIRHKRNTSFSSMMSIEKDLAFHRNSSKEVKEAALEVNEIKGSLCLGIRIYLRREERLLLVKRLESIYVKEKEKIIELESVLDNVLNLFTEVKDSLIYRLRLLDSHDESMIDNDKKDCCGQVCLVF